jgi:hypothetical protein
VRRWRAGWYLVAAIGWGASAAVTAVGPARWAAGWFHWLAAGFLAATAVGFLVAAAIVAARARVKMR